jgi:hypothetical protein
MPADALLWILVGLALGVTLSMLFLVAYAALERRAIIKRGRPARPAASVKDEQPSALRRRAKAALSVPIEPAVTSAEAAPVIDPEEADPSSLVALTRALEARPPEIATAPEPLAEPEPEPEPTPPPPEPVIILPPPKPAAPAAPPPAEPVVIDAEARSASTPEPKAKPVDAPVSAAPPPAAPQAVPVAAAPAPAAVAKVRRPLEVTPPPVIKPPPMPGASATPAAKEPGPAPTSALVTPVPPPDNASAPPPAAAPVPDDVIGGVRFAPVPKRPAKPERDGSGE